VINRKSYIILLTILIYGNLLMKAQQWGATFSIGKAKHAFCSESFENWLNNYNNADDFSQNLIKPFDSKLKPFRGLSINFAVFATNGFDTRISNGWTFLRSKGNYAEFSNNDKRHFDVYITEWNLDWGVGFSFGSFYANLLIGANNRFGLIDSYFEYRNGTISYGQESTSNCYQRVWRIAGFWGYVVGIPIVKHLQVVFKGDYTFRDNKNEIYKTVFFDELSGFGPLYNDFKGWKYTLSLQLILGSEE
jgi:hypothetical protein